MVLNMECKMDHDLSVVAFIPDFDGTPELLKKFIDFVDLIKPSKPVDMFNADGTLSYAGKVYTNREILLLVVVRSKLKGQAREKANSLIRNTWQETKEKFIEIFEISNPPENVIEIMNNPQVTANRNVVLRNGLLWQSDSNILKKANKQIPEINDFHNEQYFENINNHRRSNNSIGCCKPYIHSNQSNNDFQHFPLNRGNQQNQSNKFNRRNKFQNNDFQNRNNNWRDCNKNNNKIGNNNFRKKQNKNSYNKSSKRCSKFHQHQ